MPLRVVAVLILIDVTKYSSMGLMGSMGFHGPTVIVKLLAPLLFYWFGRAIIWVIRRLFVRDKKAATPDRAT